MNFTKTQEKLAELRVMIIEANFAPQTTLNELNDAFLSELNNIILQVDNESTTSFQIPSVEGLATIQDILTPEHQLAADQVLFEFKNSLDLNFLRAYINSIPEFAIPTELHKFITAIPINPVDLANAADIIQIFNQVFQEQVNTYSSGILSSLIGMDILTPEHRLDVDQVLLGIIEGEV